MARYLVTGGAGFIGSHIVTRLVDEGHQVRVFDNLCTGSLANLAHLGDAVEFHEGDLRDASEVQRVVDGCEYVFHQAALASVPLGGTIDVTMAGDAEAPEFLVEAKGPKPRLGPHVLDLLADKSESGQVDAHGFQVFYTGEIARAATMAVTITLDEQMVRIVAKPENA